MEKMKDDVDVEEAVAVDKRSGLRRNTSLRRVASHSTPARSFQGLRFINDSEGWSDVEKRFKQHAVDGLLPRSRFGICIGMEQEQFAMKLFDALAQKRGIVRWMINKEQLEEFWNQLSCDNFDDRLQIFFDMVDKDADERITEQELKQIIISSASANKLRKIQDRADEYVELIMEEHDPDGHRYIELQSLKKLLVKWSGQSSIANDKPKPVPTTTTEANLLTKWFSRPIYIVQDNWKRIWVLLLWLSICTALFTWKFVQYKRRYVFHVMGYCVCTAKGGAESSKFNMALILLPVCRNTITWLRNHTRLGKIIPFDDHIKFHQLVAAGIAASVGLHVIAHMACDFPRLVHASDEAYTPLKPYFGEHKPPNYWWFVRGVEGVTGIAMVVLMAIAYTLAQPSIRNFSTKRKLPSVVKMLTGFNAFWYSHHLFVIVYALLIVHGTKLYLQQQWYKKTTWMYIAVPMIVYACERLIRKSRAAHKPPHISQVAVYPGQVKVLGLHITKPDDFNYTSGQYIFVKCHEVSPFEWHPFSLTSAPGDDYISVHIKASGDWTSALTKLFSQAILPTTGASDESALIKVDIEEGSLTPRVPSIKIDGPYGAPAQAYKNYDVLLLVGLGIGATPLISIMKDVVGDLNQKHKADDIECGVSTGNINGGRQRGEVKKAYLYWSTREQSSFDWFQEEMNAAIEQDDERRVMEIHNYCTSVKEEGDARSAFITALQNLYYDKHGVDVVSGTRVMAHFAKPDWPTVFQRVAHTHKNQRIGVFYCGPPDVGRVLRQLAQGLSRDPSTTMEFHKENF